MRRFGLLVLLALAGGFLGATPGAAQQGSVVVRVTDAETGGPLSDVNVEILGSGGAQAAGGLTDRSGLFRAEVAAGTYQVLVSLLGYETLREDGVEVTSGGSRTVQITLKSQALELNPVVVTASRRQEKALDAPASVSIVSREKIAERVALTPVEHVKNEPGMDVVQTGLTQSNVVSRGFNNVFSGAMLVITDNRYAFVPSLRVNAFNFIPSTDLDLDRMEIVLGPGAALYGPNASSGVMNMVTASPIDRPGSTMTLAGGNRSVFQGAFRSAWANPGGTFGVKVSGKYFQGNDWEYRDPVEEQNRQDLIDAGQDPGLVAARDFDSQVFGGDARLEWRPREGRQFVVQGGVNNAASTIELTGIGAGQAQDWAYSYLQSWYRAGRFYAQAFMNASNAGDTYLLRTGEPIVDKSRMFAAQVQHGFDLGDRQSFTYGVDLQRTDPDTEGTINGRNEDDDQIDEAGIYIHSESRITDNFDLVLAFRGDVHSELDEPNWSPRAALVWRPQENQNIRFTYNRAFSTPTTNNLFLDLLASRIPLGPGVGYDVRTLGVPSSGFNFTPGCPGGVGDFCMYSPFAPGAALPANGVVAWDALVQQFAPTLAPFLPNPGASVGTILRRLNTEEGAFPVDADFLANPNRNIARIQSTTYNTFEVGYKGVIGNRLSLTANLYTTRIEDFVGPLRVETPTVFLDPATTAQYIQQQLAPLIQAGAISPEEVAALIEGFASVPIGTISPDENPNSDILLTYRNFGEVDFWGGELAAQYLVSNRLSIRGNYAYVSKDCFDFNEDGDCSSAEDIALNAPQNKFTVSGRFDDARKGWAGEIRYRWVDSFPMNSGVYIGTVDSYGLVDVNLDYRLPMFPGTSIGFTGTNIFDVQHRQFVGAPELGSLFLFRVSYEF